jgi:hypothetical protein
MLAQFTCADVNARKLLIKPIRIRTEIEDRLHISEATQAAGDFSTSRLLWRQCVQVGTNRIR